MKKISVMAVVALLALAVPALGDTITFDDNGLVSSHPTTYVESGMQITSTTAGQILHLHIYLTPTTGVGLASGTSVDPIQFQMVDGSTFDLISVDVVEGANIQNSFFEVVDAGGTSNTTSISFSGGPSTVFFPSEFQNITSFLWKYPFTPGPEGFAIIDNLTFNPSNPVPEPTTMALLGVGAAGLFVAHRRRKAKKA